MTKVARTQNQQYPQMGVFKNLKQKNPHLGVMT